MSRPLAPVADRARPMVFLLVAGTVLLPLQIWPAMPLTGMQFSDLLFALAFLQFLRTGIRFPPAAGAVALAAFAAGAGVSALFGGSPVKLLGHFELVAVGWMAACLPPDGARWLRRGLVAAAALAALTALAGLVVYFAGFASYDAAGSPDNPLLYIHGSLVSDHYPRPRGTLVTGAMLTSVVATGLALLWFDRALIPRAWLRCLIYGACVIALFFAFSRPIATLGVVLAGIEIWRRDSPAWQRRAYLTGAAVFAAALWVSLRYHVVLNPLEPWTIDVLAEDGDRFGRWRISAAVILQHPLVGLGPGVGVADGWSAHNTWLNLWAVLGVVPLAAFAFLLAAALRAAAGARSLALIAALIFALVESTYNDIEDMRHVWLLMGIALGSLPPAGRTRDFPASAAGHDTRS